MFRDWDMPPRPLPVVNVLMHLEAKGLDELEKWREHIVRSDNSHKCFERLPKTTPRIVLSEKTGLFSIEA